jgi:hypothetical protein
VPTREVFDEVLHDEAFHMSYTHTQLGRVAPGKTGRRLWQARLGRIWKTYLRLAAAVASVMGTLLLRAQYFLFLPLFAFLAAAPRATSPTGS